MTKHMSRYTFLLYLPKKEITVKTNEKLRKIFTYRVEEGSRGEIVIYPRKTLHHSFWRPHLEAGS